MVRTVLLSLSPVRTFPPPSFEPHLWSTKCLRSTLKLRSGDPGIGGNGTHEQRSTGMPFEWCSSPGAPLTDAGAGHLKCRFFLPHPPLASGRSVWLSKPISPMQCDSRNAVPFWPPYHTADPCHVRPSGPGARRARECLT